jgi:hypothetical protein
MRRWAYDGETPVKERKENGRMAWPVRFKMHAVTVNRVFPDDVPLFPKDDEIDPTGGS